jgi:hypothetical protein
MIQRCENRGHKSYSDYGGRGVTVDPSWHTFKNFIADMGERPEGTTLDRIDVNGNYCKENCRWVDRSMQERNKRPRSDWGRMGYSDSPPEPDPGPQVEEFTEENIF